ncbi:MAG TPA: response regulator [Pyrinomonadaceae bacterium]|jgi:DNA-binding response OmpR family regulator
MNNVLQFPISSHDFARVSSFVPEPPRLIVLVAESDRAERSELKELLDLYGVDVLEAENGEQAVDLTVRECPNLVLMNAVLPELDGYEAARLIRSIQSFDRMPIIFLSGETERVYRKKAFEVGADGFHIAPLDFDRLDHILENFLFRTPV